MPGERGTGIRAAASRVVNEFNELQNGDSDSTVALHRAIKALEKALKQRAEAQKQRRAERRP